jgi:hypothetical protein
MKTEEPGNTIAMKNSNQLAASPDFRQPEDPLTDNTTAESIEGQSDRTPTSSPLESLPNEVTQSEILKASEGYWLQK